MIGERGEKFTSFIDKRREGGSNRVLDWTPRQIISCEEEEAGGFEVWRPECGGGRGQVCCRGGSGPAKQ